MGVRKFGCDGVGCDWGSFGGGFIKKGGGSQKVEERAWQSPSITPAAYP